MHLGPVEVAEGGRQVLPQLDPHALHAVDAIGGGEVPCPAQLRQDRLGVRPRPVGDREVPQDAPVELVTTARVAIDGDLVAPVAVPGDVDDQVWRRGGGEAGEHLAEGGTARRGGRRGGRWGDDPGGEGDLAHRQPQVGEAQVDGGVDLDCGRRRPEHELPAYGGVVVQGQREAVEVPCHAGFEIGDAELGGVDADYERQLRCLRRGLDRERGAPPVDRSLGDGVR